MPKPIIHDDSTISSPVYTQDDFVFCKKPNGDITSCGFRIDSTLMKYNESPFVIYSNSENDSSSLNSSRDVFRNKTVPMGIYHDSFKRTRYPTDIDEQSTELEIDDDLYEKLLSLVEVSSMSSNKKDTRKITRHDKKRKTKKRKH